MHIRRKAGHRILGGDHGIVMREGIAYGRFDTEIGGDAGKDHRPDAAAAKLQIHLGAVKGAPVMLDNTDIGGKCGNLRRYGKGCRRQPAFRKGQHLVGRLVDSIGIVRGESDGDEDDRSAGRLQTGGDCGGVFNDLLAGMGCQRSAKDEALQVDGNESGGRGIVKRHERAPENMRISSQ